MRRCPHDARWAHPYKRLDQQQEVVIRPVECLLVWAHRQLAPTPTDPQVLSHSAPVPTCVCIIPALCPHSY